MGVAPHVRRPLGDALTAEHSSGDLRLQGVVVVGNLQRRETVVADGAGLVSPAASAFPTPQFVVRHGLLAFLFRKLEFRKLEIKASSWVTSLKKAA